MEEKLIEIIGGLPFAIGISLAGMFVHFLKKKIKGEHFTDVKNYFADNPKSTVIAVVVTIVGAIAYYMKVRTGIMEADIMAYFGIGFTFDSLFNKWEGKQNEN